MIVMIPRQSHPDPENDPDLTEEKLRQICGTWKMLRRLSGISSTVYRYIDRIATAQRPTRVMVVPTHDAEIPLSWAKRSRLAGREIDLTLVNVSHDPSTDALISQRIDEGYAIQCVELDLPNDRLPTGFDVVTSLYLMHQLREDQVFRRLQTFACASDGPLVVCDFARSQVNAWLAQSASPLVRASYSIDEFRRLAERALARPIHIRSAFPCHFVMVCEEQTKSEPVPAFA